LFPTKSSCGPLCKTICCTTDSCEGIECINTALETRRGRILGRSVANNLDFMLREQHLESTLHNEHSFISNATSKHSAIARLSKRNVARFAREMKATHDTTEPRLDFRRQHTASRDHLGAKVEGNVQTSSPDESIQNVTPWRNIRSPRVASAMRKVYLLCSDGY
jgi:hypothetical protein